jgi:serine/threonine protein phosphatase PrpC
MRSLSSTLILWPSGSAIPFAVGPETDREGFLQLFALVVNDVRTQAATTGRQFEVQPGLLLIWAATKPQLSDLEVGAASAASAAAPQNWPGNLRSRWRALRGGLFLYAVGLATKHAKLFEIRDGAQACRLLAAIAQTLLTQRKDVRLRNLALASRYYEAARRRIGARSDGDVFQIEQPDRLERSPLLSAYDRRDDEAGARVETAGLAAWYASHIGPHGAAKPQNQDAAHVIADGRNLIFALADGVSTSTGARLAAAAVVVSFCDAVKTALSAGHPPDVACLASAVRTTQLAMDALLGEVLKRWETESFSELHDRVPRDSALIFLQNTARPARARLDPALATTLIGGVVTVADSSSDAVGHVIRIGDGIVEHIGRNGEVATLFDMVRTESAISEILAPGPRGRAAIDQLASVAVCLEPNEFLLLSSDGLTRGHELTVWRELQETFQGDFGGALKSKPEFARLLLDDAASAADTIRKNKPHARLFDDNLSLILINRTPN